MAVSAASGLHISLREEIIQQTENVFIYFQFVFNTAEQFFS